MRILECGRGDSAWWSLGPGPPGRGTPRPSLARKTIVAYDVTGFRVLMKSVDVRCQLDGMMYGFCAVGQSVQ